jgi:hypothetical protein
MDRMQGARRLVLFAVLMFIAAGLAATGLVDRPTAVLASIALWAGFVIVMSLDLIITRLNAIEQRLAAHLEGKSSAD